MTWRNPPTTETREELERWAVDADAVLLAVWRRLDTGRFSAVAIAPDEEDRAA